jgi:hypothetical protein
VYWQATGTVLSLALIDALLAAIGVAVACFLATVLLPVALRASRVWLMFIPTVAWRFCALVPANLVPAQPMPALYRAHRGGSATTAVAKDAAVRLGTTLLRLANPRLSLSRTLRTFGSELHGQWRAEEGIAPPPSLPSPSPALYSSGGLALGRDSPAATFLAHSAGYL